mgnify:CR=1 FL=1
MSRRCLQRSRNFIHSANAATHTLKLKPAETRLCQSWSHPAFVKLETPNSSSSGRPSRAARARSVASGWRPCGGAPIGNLRHHVRKIRNFRSPKLVRTPPPYTSLANGFCILFPDICRPAAAALPPDTATSAPNHYYTPEKRGPKLRGHPCPNSKNVHPPTAHLRYNYHSAGGRYDRGADQPLPATVRRGRPAAQHLARYGTPCTCLSRRHTGRHPIRASYSGPAAASS